MNPHLSDPEIKNRRQISSLLNIQEFEKLKNKFLLFDVDSDLALFSGQVTASLFQFEDEKSVLAVNSPVKGWVTFKLTNEEFEKMMENCWLVCGEFPEDSFIPYV